MKEASQERCHLLSWPPEHVDVVRPFRKRVVANCAESAYHYCR